MRVEKLGRRTIRAIIDNTTSDYVPDGELVDLTKVELTFHSTMDAFRCGACTCNDIQSGDIFCGNIADFIARLPDGKLVCLCKAHSSKLTVVRSCTEVHGEIKVYA